MYEVRYRTRGGGSGVLRTSSGEDALWKLRACRRDRRPAQIRDVTDPADQILVGWVEYTNATDDGRWRWVIAWDPKIEEVPNVDQA